MSCLEVTFTTDDPGIARLLATAQELPVWHPERLAVEAALSEWHAARCREQIGESVGYHRAEQAVSNRNRRPRAALAGSADDTREGTT